jgi:3-hydroxybutyrate dehydrogenase
MGISMDVASEDAVNGGVAAVVKAWGGVDVLVSIAGTQIVHPMHESLFIEQKRLLAIDLDGDFFTAKACLPHTSVAGKGGRIVHRGSVTPSWLRRGGRPMSPPRT